MIQEIIGTTQESLKNILNYDSTTGIFTWKIRAAVKTRIGDIAGTLGKDGYIRISIGNRKCLAHRLDWLYTFGEFPPDMVDHVDGNKSNNKLSNLRKCSQGENMKNQGIRLNNSSGFKGVSPHKQSGKYQATTTIDGKRKYLGLYLTPEEAFLIADGAAKANHGEFYKDTRTVE